MLRTAALNKLSYADALKKTKEQQTTQTQPTKTVETTSDAQLTSSTAQKLKDDIMREACAIMDESLRKLKAELLDAIKIERGDHYSDMDFVMGHFASFAENTVALLGKTVGNKIPKEAKINQDEIMTVINAVLEGQETARKELTELGFNNTQNTVPDEDLPPEDEC